MTATIAFVFLIIIAFNPPETPKIKNTFKPVEKIEWSVR